MCVYIIQNVKLGCVASRGVSSEGVLITAQNDAAGRSVCLSVNKPQTLDQQLPTNFNPYMHKHTRTNTPRIRLLQADESFVCLQGRLAPALHHWPEGGEPDAASVPHLWIEVWVGGWMGDGR